VTTLLDHVEMDQGYQSIEYDASNLSSGIYFYKIQAENLNSGGASAFTAVRKMVLMK